MFYAASAVFKPYSAGNKVFVNSSIFRNKRHPYRIKIRHFELQWTLIPHPLQETQIHPHRWQERHPSPIDKETGIQPCRK